jgi:hypothetical protein
VAPFVSDLDSRLKGQCHEMIIEVRPQSARISKKLRFVNPFFRLKTGSFKASVLKVAPRVYSETSFVSLFHDKQNKTSIVFRETNVLLRKILF